MEVIKRDGRKKKFDITKINKAIVSSFKSTDVIPTDEQLNSLLQSILKKLGNRESVSVEEIQDIVEEILMGNYPKVAKNYILYRDERTKQRKKKDAITKVYLAQLEGKVNEKQNANVDELSFGGRKGEASSTQNKDYALDYYMSPKMAKNHRNNRIYIHDLDSYIVGMHNCVEENMWINILTDGKPRTLKIKDFVKELDFKVGELSLDNRNIQILSRDGYTSLLNIWGRKTNTNESVYTLKTKVGLPLKLTGEHKVPVLRNGKEELVYVKDLQIGDELLSSCCSLSKDTYYDAFLPIWELKDIDLRISNSEKIYQYLIYKYDVYYTRYAKEHKLSNQHDINIDMSIEDLKVIMNDFQLDWDLLSMLRIKACGSKKTYPLYIPYSESLAKLYAYIYADGGVYINEDDSTFQLTFTNTNEDLIDDFISCYKDVFGYTLKKSYPKENWNSPCIRVTDGSRIAVKLFKDFCGAKKYGSADISVPDFVMNGSESIKYAYLSACIDTDGCLGESITYTTCGESYSEQILMLLKSLGFNPTKVKSHHKGSTYKVGPLVGIRNFDGYNISLRRNDEIYTFYNRLNCFKSTDKYSYKGISKNYGTSKIIEITQTYEDTYVYDFETKSHWFITNNFVVHNCLSVPFDNLLRDGFTVKQTDIRPANSIGTAFQLLAVIFQIQSLQQFGGVSATHLDWTMVPYVRKSFYKYFKEGLKYVENKNEKQIEEITKKILEKDS